MRRGLRSAAKVGPYCVVGSAGSGPQRLRLERELSRHGQEANESRGYSGGRTEATRKRRGVIYRNGPPLTEAVEEIQVLQERFATAGIDDLAHIQRTELTALPEVVGMLDVALAIVESGFAHPVAPATATDFRTGTTSISWRAPWFIESDRLLWVGYASVTITRWPRGGRVYGRGKDDGSNCHGVLPGIGPESGIGPDIQAYGFRANGRVRTA